MADLHMDRQPSRMNVLISELEGLDVSTTQPGQSLDAI